MIVKIPGPRTAARRLLDYLDGHGTRQSELLLSNMPGRTTAEWAEFLERHSRTHRPRLNKFVKHIVLSFAPGEELDRADLRAITTFFLNQRGFGDAPFVAYYHLDTPHPHIHIVTTPTSWEGKRISTSWEKKLAMPVAREIERKWGLVSGEKRARRSRPTRDLSELRRQERSGHVTEHQRFQRDLTRAAQQSRSLSQFMDNAYELGYDVRATLDSAGQLRGLAFARQGTRFKGSQLGQDFKGGRFLTAFGLAYRPEQDAALVLGRPSPAAARLPDGMTYRLLAVPTKTGTAAYITSFADRTVMGVAARELEGAVVRLSSRFPEATLLVRPEEGFAERIGLRGLSSAQVRNLRAEGLEPQWLVQTGREFDGLFRLPASIPEHLRSGLQERLVEEFQLSPDRQQHADYVRLPDPANSPKSEETVSRLIEHHAQVPAIPAHFLREAEARDDLRYENLGPESISSELPLSVAWTSPPEQAKPLADGHPLAAVAREIEQQDLQLNSRQPRPFEELSVRELVEHAIGAQGHLLERLRSQPEVSALKLPDATTLVEVERELALRARGLESHVEKLEPIIYLQHLAFERATRTLPAEPSLDQVREYQRQLHSFHSRLEALEHLVAELKVAAQVRSALAGQREAFPYPDTRLERASWLRDFESALTPHSLERPLGRVAEGETSSATLRRLNAGIVAQSGTERLPLPIYDLPSEISALHQRGSTTEAALRASAASLRSDPDQRTPVALARLFGQATELLEIRRRLDQSVRAQLGISDPIATIGTRDPETRALQWLEHAHARGLSPDQALSHLAHSGRGPFESPLAISGRVAWLVISLASHLGRMATRFLDRVLRQ